MSASHSVQLSRADCERAYRADGTYILSIAPWLFLVGMTIEAASHWSDGSTLLFWAPVVMAVMSLMLLVATRRKAIGQEYPDAWLLVYFGFMMTTSWTHFITAPADQVHLSQLVLAVTAVATGGLILPTVVGCTALGGAGLALFAAIAFEFPDEALQKAVVPVMVMFMALLLFLARRWAIRQALQLRVLDNLLAASVAEAEAARRVADFSTRMSAGFAHHFNNLLQGGLLGAEGAKRAFDNGEPPDEWLDIVESAVKRGIDLTAQLVRYAQPIVLEKCVVSANEFVVGLEMSGVVADEREVVRRAEDVEFIADITQLRLAVYELLRNADTAMRDSAGPLFLDVENRDGMIYIIVRDTGSGVPESLEGHPTDAFVTGDPVKRFGLGLALAAQIARLHGGDLALGPAPDGGTMATLSLPAVPASEAPQENLSA